MIISCEKCNKKFEISDELIPDEGRLLQCGSCSYEWHYSPTKTIKLVNEINQVSEAKKKTKKIKKKIIKENNEISMNQKTDSSEKKRVGFLSVIIVAIISLIALIVIADTFKVYIIMYISNFLKYYMPYFVSTPRPRQNPNKNSKITTFERGGERTLEAF